MDKVCLVIDFDGFGLCGGEFLIREMGFIAMDWPKPKSFHLDLSKSVNKLTEKDKKTVSFVRRKIHRLPFEPKKDEPVIPLEDLKLVLHMYYDCCKDEEKFVVAYKGGHYEKDFLQIMNVPSLDLEPLGCPKFVDFDYHYLPNCGFHDDIDGRVHCPAAETLVFRDWCLEQLRNDSPGGRPRVYF